MLVLGTSNFQGETIRPIVPRREHFFVFIVSVELLWLKVYNGSAKQIAAFTLVYNRKILLLADR